MIGPMANEIRDSVGFHLASRGPLDLGACIYYREGACSSERVPRCPHHALGLCLGAGKCGDISTRYYTTPDAILQAMPLELDA